jgi:hypothetical protein
MLRHNKAHENINLQTGAPKLDIVGPDGLLLAAKHTSLEAVVTFSTAVQQHKKLN